MWLFQQAIYFAIYKGGLIEEIYIFGAFHFSPEAEHKLFHLRII
jgi:hypothetical protein